MILLIDNYDSFTYNLYQAVRGMGYDCKVVRNDELTVSQIKKLRPAKLILSPGPGRPEDAGVTLAVIRELSPHIPTLGVCLGHQAMAMAFGGKVVRAKKLMHGKTCRIRHDGKGLFAGLKQNLEVMRYHSLVAERASLPKCLAVTARTDDGLVMGLRHKFLPVEGVQFHPESVMTPEGPAMIRNFLEAKWQKTKSS
jgi:anthranilate synthase/aminodeoxychorismate synthase-like glutamine amidotransferase